LYCLIILFSLCWPPIKLICIAALSFLPLQRQTRRTSFAVLAQLGRWSLLDVYFIILFQLMFALQDHEITTTLLGFDISLGELSIAIDVGYGTILFHLAIIFSIASVYVLDSADRQALKTGAAPIADLESKGGPEMLDGIIPAGLPKAIGGVSFSVTAFALVFVGFFGRLFTVDELPKADDLGFTDLLLPNEWSLANGTFGYLMDVGGLNGFFGFGVFVFTLLTPMACTAALVVASLPFLGVSMRRWSYGLARELSAWSQLEVMFLAMIVYMSQSESLVTVILGPAFWSMLAYIVALIVAFPIVHQLVGGRD